MREKNTLLVIGLGLLMVYLLVVQITVIWPFTIDDMYISLRYAQHWVQGDGLLWNIGEPPVEGYSNFLFVCLAALAIKLGLNPVFFLKMVGVVGLFLTVGALYRLSRFWFSVKLALIPVLWLLFYCDEIIWVASGLETTLYQALLLFSVCSLLRGLGYQSEPEVRGQLQRKYWVIAGVLLAIAGLTRPEGAVVGLFFFAIAYLDLPKKRDSQHYLDFMAGVSVFALIYAPYFMWRWHYFGMLLPNSVYCKGFATSHWLLLDKAYLNLVWPFLLLALVEFISSQNIPILISQSWGKGHWWSVSAFRQGVANTSIKTRYDRRLYFLWTPSIIYLIFLAQADPVSAMGQRLFLPALVLLLPLVLIGIQHTVDYFLRQEGFTRALIIGVSVVWVTLFWLPSASLKNLVYATYNPLAGEQLRMQVVGWLKDHVSAEDHIVLADSGLIPYFIPAHFEDSYCLNNKMMAKESYNAMFDRLCEYTLRQKPKVIILTSLAQGGETIYSPTDDCLNKKLHVNPDYQKSMFFQTPLVLVDSRYRYEIYTRRI